MARATRRSGKRRSSRRLSRRRSSRRPPVKDWYEEDWALPVLVIFGAGLVKVVLDMRQEALAKKAAAQGTAGLGGW